MESVFNQTILVSIIFIQKLSFNIFDLIQNCFNNDVWSIGARSGLVKLSHDKKYNTFSVDQFLNFHNHSLKQWQRRFESIIWPNCRTHNHQKSEIHRHHTFRKSRFHSKMSSGKQELVRTLALESCFYLTDEKTNRRN